MPYAVTPVEECAEDVDSFRQRARFWLKSEMPQRKSVSPHPDDEERWGHARDLQGRLFAGGFAGICYPSEFGGQGLSHEHQRAFDEEAQPYELPTLLNLPSLAICLPTILELGSDEQRRAHIPAALRGDEVIVEFLSESHSGSDLAGALTRAEPDGANWVINGSKIWTSSAFAGDYAMCLARTNWEVPKHRGLTMFLVPVKHPGVTVRRIRQANGNSEFCEEFLDDVVVGPEAVLGEVDGGWAVASHRFYYSRTALGGGNPYVSGSHADSVAQSRGISVGGSEDLRRLAVGLGGPLGSVPDAVVDATVMETVRESLAGRITGAVKAGVLPIEAASMMRLFHAQTDWACVDAALPVAGSYAATGRSADDSGAGAFGEAYLFRQATSLGGGSTEMARNVISERVLHMPREDALDVRIPFKDVRRGPS
jgi:alkylation response protein AidB-like acyl-CoA dehydrogenase